MCGSKSNMLMFVYNDLNQDARVQRSVEALKNDFNIVIVSIDFPCSIDGVENKILKSKYASGAKKYFDIVFQFIKLARSVDYDYLYLHDYYSCILGCFLNKKDSKIIYDAHELLLDSKIKNMSYRERFFYFFEEKLIKKCDYVIAAQEKRASIMQKHYNMSYTPFVVPNYSELPTNDLYQSSDAINKFFDYDGKKIFVYAGALDKSRGIDILIQEASKVSDSYKVLIVGDGPQKKELEALASKFIKLKYCFTGNVPYKYLGSILKKCDVGYVSYKTNDLNNLYCAPNKVYEYASVELPMICNDNPTLYNIVAKNEIGIIISDSKEIGTSSTVSAALDILFNNYGLYKNNINKFRRLNSWEDFSEVYRKKILSL